MRDFNWQNYPRRMLIPASPWLPFPGLYPTRWAIQMRWGPNRKTGFNHDWKYLGKPNAGVARFVRLILQTARYSEVQATEFIRNGAIANGLSYGQHSNLAIQDWCASKFRLVDPWNGHPNQRLITQWGELPMRPLPLTYKEHKFVIYATQGSVTVGRLEEYKRWLDAQNIKFSRQ